MRVIEEGPDAGKGLVIRPPAPQAGGGTGGDRDTDKDRKLAVRRRFQFHLKGTANDHDQSTHAGGGGTVDDSVRSSAAELVKAWQARDITYDDYEKNMVRLYGKAGLPEPPRNKKELFTVPRPGVDGYTLVDRSQRGPRGHSTAVRYGVISPSGRHPGSAMSLAEGRRLYKVVVLEDLAADKDRSAG
jgi:hypothetical protein